MKWVLKISQKLDLTPYKYAQASLIIIRKQVTIVSFHFLLGVIGKLFGLVNPPNLINLHYENPVLFWSCHTMQAAGMNQKYVNDLSVRN